MEQSPLPFRRIAFVCINWRPSPETCCANQHGEAIAAALKERIKALGLARWVRVSKSGCQDQCAKGANVMVFPEGAWYHGVTPDDVEQIIEHLTRGLPPSS